MLIKATRKATTHSFVQFDPSNYEALGKIEGMTLRYNGGTWELWNPTRNSWLAIGEADLLNVNNPADIYPVDAATFRELYTVEA